MAATSEPKTWLLDRYARFVPSDKNSEGEWKYFSSYGCESQMKISIVEPLKLLITSGSSIALESITLYGLEKEPCVKAIHKGDSMLFFCKSKDSVRRFRIQFSKGQASNERSNCNDFLRVISEYIQVKTVECHDDENISQSGSQSMLTNAASQSQLNSSVEYLPPNKALRSDIPDSRIFAAKSVRQIAESLLANNPNSYSPDNCKSGSIPVANDDVDSLVRSCLLDPEFPSFVANVEESIKRLIAE